MDSGEPNAVTPDEEPVGEPQSGMQDWLSEHEQPYRQLRRGEVVEGVVVQVGRDEILVDIGAKAEAVIPANELAPRETEAAPTLAVGDQVTAYVLNPEDREGHAILSLARARAEQGWRDLQQAHESGETVEGEVVGHNKGGLVVTVHGVRGFVPLSQISDLRRTGDEAQLEAQLEAMRGQTLLLKVLELHRRKNRLILSERATLPERRARDKERLLNELQPGETRHGVVSSVCDFGIFVDLGGADGLVHLSELSWGQVGHPSQMLKVGDQVDVYVLAVDREARKIALSLKRLQAEPWGQLAEKYSVGQEVQVKITKLAPFGAFAEIEPGIEGLIHISELSEERIAHPKQVVREGEVVPVRIIRIDPARHRLGLSLRQATGVDEYYDDEPLQPAELDQEPLERAAPSEEPVAQVDAPEVEAEDAPAAPASSASTDEATAEDAATDLEATSNGGVAANETPGEKPGSDAGATPKTTASAVES